MTWNAQDLARRRTALVARCSQLRAEVAAAAVPLQARLAPADRVVSAARAHPVLTALASGAAALVVGRFFPSLSRVLRAALFLARF